MRVLLDSTLVVSCDASYTISSMLKYGRFLRQVQDRFKLDLTDEQADAHFLSLVSQSVTALAPRVLEVMHQIRVAAR